LASAPTTTRVGPLISAMAIQFRTETAARVIPGAPF
jgi:hypothetical protein